MMVVWRITGRCNLSCPFCAYDRRVGGFRREVAAETLQHFGRVLAGYQQTTGDAVLVSWMGGEPFLYPGLEEVTRWFVRELKLRVSVTTNGTTLHRDSLRRHILENYAELTVSMDGAGAVHDGLRGWPGGAEMLRKTIMALRAARAGDTPRLRANVVLMRQTLAGFEGLCQELAGWGIEEITFNQLGGRDRPEFYPAHRLLPGQADELGRIIPGLRARLAAAGVQLKGGPGYLARIQASSRGQAMPVADCHPGEQCLFVNEDGIVSPCHFTTREYGVDTRELADAAALRQLPGRFARSQRERRSAGCEDCHSTQVFDKFTV